jgi:UDP-N-acetylmuramoyl-L-alanyl-D-glutamate--2,6-diaminopimelate ligase
MGQAAGAASDVVVLTSDNPRSEDPQAILDDVLPGLRGARAVVLVEPDRERAIQMALGEAHPGDLVLLAGKGHEKTQILGDRVIPFDDAEIARETLARMRKQ